jgi:hypothetical protein
MDDYKKNIAIKTGEEDDDDKEEEDSVYDHNNEERRRRRRWLQVGDHLQASGTQSQDCACAGSQASQGKKPTGSHPTGALYSKFWMKKSQNTPVWLSKIVRGQVDFG